MSTPSNAVPGFPRIEGTALCVITASRRMYWSCGAIVGTRSIYIAPLAAAAVFLLAFLTACAQPRHRHEPLDGPYESRLL